MVRIGINADGIMIVADIGSEIFITGLEGVVATFFGHGPKGDFGG